MHSVKFSVVDWTPIILSQKIEQVQIQKEEGNDVEDLKIFGRMKLHETIDGIRKMLAHKQEDLLDYPVISDCVNHIFVNYTVIRK